MNTSTSIGRSAEEWIAAKRRKPTTVAIYRHSAEKLAHWRQSTDDLSTLSRREARQFIAWLHEQYQPGGVKTRVKTVKGFYEWMVTEEMIDRNPFKGLVPEIEREPQPRVTDEELDMIIRRAKRDTGRNAARNFAVLVVLADTGCRKAELASCQLGHVDLADNSIYFPESKSRKRRVELSPRAAKALRRWVRQRGDLPGSLWATKDAYGLMRRVIAKYSEHSTSPHAFRRRFAVDWMTKGGSETNLMANAGWHSTDMIALYTEDAKEDLARAEMREMFGE